MGMYYQPVLNSTDFKSQRCTDSKWGYYFLPGILGCMPHTVQQNYFWDIASMKIKPMEIGKAPEMSLQWKHVHLQVIQVQIFTGTQD